MSEKSCAECGNPNIFYMCTECNRSYCWEHTASNERFQCPRCKAEYSKIDLIEMDDYEFKCRTIEKSRCPQCKSPLLVQKNEKGQLYFKCSRCDWNSLFNAPLIAVTSEQELIQEGVKKGVLFKKVLRPCGAKLKQLKSSDQYLFCLGCFTDLLEQGDVFPFDQIAKIFNLNPETIPTLLKLYRDKGKLKGVIDPIKKVYISLKKDYQQYLINKILSEQIKLKDLANEMNLEERQVRLLVLNLTKNHSIMGRFLDAHTYIADELIYQEVANIIKDQGSVKVVDIQAKFRLANEKETKQLISETIKKGLIKAFYSPDSSTVIHGEGIQTKLLEILQQKGKIYIDRTSKALGIHPNLLRNQLKQFIDNDQIEGWYTQDRGFATLDYLKTELLGILKLYEKISLKELVSRMFLPIKYVEILLQTLIDEGKLAGALSDGVFKRAEIAPLVQRTQTMPAWMIKKIEAAKNLQYILIIHKLSGACLFSYACSELNFDPDLVSGFLQAISSFGSEVSSRESGLEEIRYQGFVVALSEGELVRSAFICNHSPDTTLRSSIKYFTIKFEDYYRSHLEKWSGDVSIFDNAGNLVEEYFKIGSKLLFLLPKISKDRTLTKEKLLKKLRDILKQKGRVSLDNLEIEIEISKTQIQKFLMNFALEGIGRFTITQDEFVTEDKLNEEVAEIILKSSEIPLAEIAQKTKIGENEVIDFLNNLINQGTIQGKIENRIFYRI
ncbi:MAG: PCI domain-containing protein [Candidatus Helarchaeota archaeon]